MRRALFLLLFVSYAYFYQAGGWNQNSRFALVRAILNEQSVRIDPYQHNTGDIAFHEGHYYSDKAPGLALAAVPVTAPFRAAYVALGRDPETFAGLALLSWVATVLTCGLLTAWAGVVLYDVAREWGTSDGAALFAALTFGLGTPMWFMATIFIGHAISAACLVFAFAAAYRISAEPEQSAFRPIGWSSQPDGRDRWQAWTVGFAAGWATVSEFPAAVPAVILALWTAWSAWQLGRRRALRIVSWLVSGALVAAAVLMVYQYLCFGSPFHLAYSSENGDFAGMHQGLFGITRPSWYTLYQVLIGEYRGLLPLSPIVFIGPLGLYLLWRDGARSVQQAAIVAGLIAAFYVFLNTSYHYWEGGWSLGPRHMAPALPFLCLGLAAVWMHVRGTTRTAVAVVTLFSFAVSFVAETTMVQPPANVTRPFREIILPAFLDGDLSLNTQSVVHHTVDPRYWRTHEEPKAAFNLGMKLGLDGHASLVPLLLAWLLCGLGLRRGLRRSDAREAADRLDATRQRR